MTTLLFVCSGNTCRSPMAACLFNALCRRDGCKELSAVSAGLNAVSGMGASLGALHAMERRGLSLEEHRSRPVTRNLLESVQGVVCMSPEHKQRLLDTFPGVHPSVRSFSPAISDPYGGSDQDYEQTARAMEPQIAAIYDLFRAHLSQGKL